MHRCTYSAEDNKIRVYPDNRIDDELGDEYASFKAAGYKWAAKQECFVCPRWTPEAEDWALRLADEIDDEDYSPEERSADRAERFEGYREKRLGEATGMADTFESGPQVFGHQNRQRAERQANRHDRLRGRAVTQWSKAEYWQHRTAGVIAHALYKSSAPVRRSRILTLEAEQRKHEKSRSEYAKRFELWSKVAGLEGADQPLPNVTTERDGLPAIEVSPAGKLAYALANGIYGHCWGEYKHPRLEMRSMSIYSLLVLPNDPITPREAAQLWLDDRAAPDNEDSNTARWSRHYELRLTYERAMLASEGGTAGEAEMEPGGWIVAGNRTGSVFTDVPGGRMQIHGVTKSPVTGRVTSVKVMGTVGYREPKPGLVSINVERLPENSYQAPTDEEREAFKQATKERKAKEKASKPKAPPLVNPTDEDAQRLQAIWNTTGRAAKQPPQEVLRMTQEQYSARSKGSYASFETVEVSEKLKELGRWSTLSECVFKVRKASGQGLYSANRVIVITDKPQKPIPWDAAEEVRATKPTEESVFPTLGDVVQAMSNYDRRNSGDGQRLINNAAYVGWAYSTSATQSGLTEAGCEAYKRFREQANPQFYSQQLEKVSA